MKRYNSYKDSGVKWIGEIPSHWEERKAKYVFAYKKDIVGERCNEYDLLSLTLQGIIKRNLDNPTGKFPASFNTYQTVNNGDFVFCLFDNEETPRTVGLSSYRGMITSAYDVLTIKAENINSRFLLYYYLTIDDAKLFKPIYKGLRKTIPYDSFMRYRIPLPPIEEQQAIVSYLDKKTSEIDELVTKVEREIELLKEYKQAVIAHVVTHGLNPNAPTKPSGISWIGDIPSHWKIRTLRNYLQLVSDKGHPDEQLLSVVREQGVIIRDVDSLEENHNFIPDDLSGYKLVKEGQFAINKMKSWQGSYGVSSYRGIVSPAYFVCDLNFGNKRFFNEAIRSRVYVPFFTQYSKGIRVGQWDLSPIGLKSIPFIEPSIEEQNEIVAYIDRKTTEIDRLIVELTYQVEYLKEYKQRLMADVVTGKINVQDD